MDVPPSEITFLSIRGGFATVSYHPSLLSPERQITERVWQSPGGAADVAFVILHGGSIHSGWYGEIGDALCSLERGRVIDLAFVLVAHIPRCHFRSISLHHKNTVTTRCGEDEFFLFSMCTVPEHRERRGDIMYT